MGFNSAFKGLTKINEHCTVSHWLMAESYVRFPRVPLRYLSVKHTEIDASHVRLCGPSSVVGIATGYGLDGPAIESRWGR